MGATSHALHIPDKKGNFKTVRELADMIHRSPSAVHYWLKRYNLKTVEDFEERYQRLIKSGNLHTSKVGKIYDTWLGPMTGKQIAVVTKELYGEVDGIRYESVYQRLLHWPEDSPAIFFPKGRKKLFEKWAKDLGIESKVLAPIQSSSYSHSPKGVRNLDTIKYCYRDNCTERCVHYNACQEEVLKNDKLMPTRFKKNGSCYSGEQLQVGISNTPENTGQCVTIYGHVFV